MLTTAIFNCLYPVHQRLLDECYDSACKIAARNAIYRLKTAAALQ